MKAVSVITFILVLVAIGFGVKVYLDQRGATEEYPIHRTITSTDGRQLDVVIHGRSASGLVVERLVDGQNFTIPLDRLDPTDREFAEDLPVNTIAEADEAGSSGTQDLDDLYVENRLERIDELRKKLVELSAELNSGKLNTSLLSVREKERDRVEEEIKSLHAAISQYKSQNGIK